MENSANVEVITKTVKYRDLLTAFAARSDCEEQILLVLHKLNKLCMDLDILKATGVGKVVNSLKSKGGAIAKSAIQLVHKWRSLVDAIDESNGSAGKDDIKTIKTANAEKDRMTDKNSKKVSLEKNHNSGATNTDNYNTSSNLNDIKYSSLKDATIITSTHNGCKEKKLPEIGKSSMPSTPVPTQKVSKADDSVKKISTNKTSLKAETAPTDDRANKKQKDVTREDSKTSKSNNPCFKSESDRNLKNLIHNDDEKKAKKRKRDGEDKDEFDNNDGDGTSNTGSFMDFCNYNYSSTINQKKKARTGTTTCDSNKMSTTTKHTPATTHNNNSNILSKPISNKSTLSATKSSDRNRSSETEMEINDYMKDLSSQAVDVLDKVKDGVKSQRDSSMDLQSFEPYEPGLRSNNRSLVFCGKRAAPIHTQILTLRQLCQKVLYDHIDCVEHVGLAPYDLMEPILKKCTAEQLEKFEFYNQHMISETDDLWMHHCKRTFPNKRPDEMETWREVYMDGQQERKVKLEKCVELIGASSAKVKNEVNKVKFIDACIVPTRRRGGWGGQQSSASSGNTHFNGGRPKQGTSLASSKGGQKQVGHLMKKTLQMIGGAKRR